jgi:hypothetical protein
MERPGKAPDEPGPRSRSHTRSALSQAYVAGMPRDLGQLIGQVDFEQARGVLMETHGYTADEALTAIEAFTRKTGTAVEECVFMLRTSPALMRCRFTTE